ncbi:B12-binding domain-containing radical SAM protein [Clostridium sp. HCP1S3_B4]|uniref:B12-binding domain-containing radical SAM protein n=1 Tax=unclassified Clostridium TaxID=2614128 RepID=UPI003F8B9734
MEYEILLINISRDCSGYSSSFRDSIGQYLLAGYIRKYNFKGFVFSGNIKECKDKIEDAICNKRVPIIGFYAAADNIRIVAHTITWIKKEYPFVKTLVGGPQSIALDNNFFNVTKNDFAIIGEGEIPLLFLLEAVVDKTRSLDTVPSLIWKDADTDQLIINHCDNAVIQDLDSIPFPSMDDSLMGNLRQGPIVGIITGRGCPYQCTFCYEGANAKNVRFRSIDNVMEEIDYITSLNPRMEYISIYDDTFTLKDERILEFCDNMRKRKLMWFCEGHITFVLNHQETLKTMIESGLSCIQFGIESGNNDVLSLYNKHTNYEMINKCISICKKQGISGITGNFIIGGANESAESIEDSKRLAKDLINNAKGIIELYVVYFAPYPNTKIVNMPEMFSMKLHPELEQYNLNTMRSPVVETRGLSTKEIYEKKHEFDEFLQAQYKEAAKNPDKRDVIQGLFHDGVRIHLNPTWEKYYLEQPHVVTFLEHLTLEEQTFYQDRYIIRTFEDVLIDGEKLITEVGVFEDVAKEVLLNATGILSAQEIAIKCEISISEMEKLFYELNNRCLVYMSEF